MARRLTIRIETKPRDIRFYPDSERISVYWEGSTYKMEDAEKWGILCSSNDVRKRRLVKDWLQHRSNNIEKIKLDLESEGILYEEWWS